MSATATRAPSISAANRRLFVQRSHRCHHLERPNERASRRRLNEIAFAFVDLWKEEPSKLDQPVYLFSSFNPIFQINNVVLAV